MNLICAVIGHRDEVILRDTIERKHVVRCRRCRRAQWVHTPYVVPTPNDIAASLARETKTLGAQTRS